MLIRISLILAIIAALAAGTLNILLVRDKITTLISQRDDERGKKQQALSDLSKAKTDLTKSQDALKQTTQDLADAKSERDKAVVTATAQTKRADELSDKLAKTTQERDDAQTQLAAYKATGMSADQVGKLSRALKESQEAVAIVNEEKVVLQRALTRLQARLAKYEGPDPTITIARRPPGQNSGGGSEMGFCRAEHRRGSGGARRRRNVGQPRRQAGCQGHRSQRRKKPLHRQCHAGLETRRSD